MPVKKRDVIEVVKRALARREDRSGSKRIGFVSLQEGDNAPSTRADLNPQLPEFEVAGWQFFAKTDLWEDAPVTDGDASFRAPNGKYVGLVWTTTGSLKYQFDFTPAFGPMLYIDVSRSIKTWDDLRIQIEPLMAEIEVEFQLHSDRR